MHLDSNSINYMFNSSFKQTEDFTYPVLPETRCPVLHLECGCLRLPLSVLSREPTVPFPSSGVCLNWVCEKNDLIQRFKMPSLIN
jgi:hypothetical protein